MTEKRFTDDGIEEIENQSFTDNLTKKTYWIDNGLDEIVELLNKLHEENEQLKQQLYCDSDDGVCPICVNHYLVRGKTYDKYYISKCKKGHEECSTEILKHCKHFKMRDGGDD